jgi:hypothetical protein
MVPMPIIASAEMTKIPAELPSELNAVRLAPTSTEFEIASSTAGPGVKHINNETPQKRSQWVIVMMGANLVALNSKYFRSVEAFKECLPLIPCRDWMAVLALSRAHTPCCVVAMS